MSARWEALAARSRGLTTHLLPDDRLRSLERAATFAELTRGLRETSYGPFLPPPRDVSPGTVETALVRSVAERMTTLARWAGPDGGVLAPLFLEEDARSVRAVLRGVAGGVAPERRLAGAIPTPSLDRKALGLLSRAGSAGEVAGALADWGHPLGSALLEEAGETHVDLFRLEATLDRALAGAASRTARRAGRHMRRFVAESLDERNVLTALVLAGARRESPPEELFVEGGACLTAPAFGRATSADGVSAAADLLAETTRGTLFAPALTEAPLTAAAVASRILAARIERLRSEGRTDPISPLPVLLFVLRLRSEARRVRRALWSAAATGGVGA